MRSGWLARLTVAVVTAVLIVPAAAEVRTWDNGAADSYWHSPDNWDPYGYAESDDLIVLSGAPTADSDVLTDNGGSITLSGPASVADFALNVTIATAGEARVDILGGADLSASSSSSIGIGLAPRAPSPLAAPARPGLLASRCTSAWAARARSRSTPEESSRANMAIWATTGAARATWSSAAPARPGQLTDHWPSAEKASGR